MRLWTLHPQYLDPAGLVALWREALLAQEVLRGRTRGYIHHPQLIRFRAHPSPLAAIASYLSAVYEEAVARSYRFDPAKIGWTRTQEQIPETEGQFLYEWGHLQRKARVRNPTLYHELIQVERPIPHPLFLIIPGKVRVWEKQTYRVPWNG